MLGERSNQMCFLSVFSVQDINNTNSRFKCSLSIFGGSLFLPERLPMSFACFFLCGFAITSVYPCMLPTRELPKSHNPAHLPGCSTHHNVSLIPNLLPPHPLPTNISILRIQVLHIGLPTPIQRMRLQRGATPRTRLRRRHGRLIRVSDALPGAARPIPIFPAAVMARPLATYSRARARRAAPAKPLLALRSRRRGAVFWRRGRGRRRFVPLLLLLLFCGFGPIRVGGFRVCRFFEVTFFFCC